jgi:hypothetical protein
MNDGIREVIWQPGKLLMAGTRAVALSAALLVFLMGSGGSVSAAQLPENDSELLAVAYPADRDVSVRLGGGARTLTSSGVCKVKWRNGAATVEMKLENLPSPAELGWAERQYVLWAVDTEQRTLNLGRVPLQGKEAKWEFRVPFRTFGLLITAETTLQAQAPGAAIALKSLLPTDPRLVVPVFRIDLSPTD